jgi:hypothetical protein
MAGRNYGAANFLTRQTPKNFVFCFTIHKISCALAGKRLGLGRFRGSMEAATLWQNRHYGRNNFGGNFFQKGF